MEFEEPDIDNLDLSESPKAVVRLIVRFLCGKNFDLSLSNEDRAMIRRMISQLAKEADRKPLSYRQINELLLMLNQDPMTKSFFEFFFGRNVKALQDLKNGVAKFRGFAMLSFGNFKFAYRELSKMDLTQILKSLQPFSKEPKKLIEEFSGRPERLLQIKKIPRQNVWFLGEVSGTKVQDEIERAVSEAEEGEKKGNPIDPDFCDFLSELEGIEKRIKQAQRFALTNTETYLTWDYMDVYVATSMRNTWEYEETFDFIRKLFEDPELKKLNIRFFDPTQSICSNARDKGLLEGLMLKTAACAIYLAQESDTMGKDSELASTLSQGKPVIAYVPRYDEKEYAEKISLYELEYFKKRLNILNAEGVFEYSDCREKLKAYDNDFEKTIKNFTEELAGYRSAQPFRLWKKKDEEFKKTNQLFEKICQIVAIAECFNFDKRALMLSGQHPLCMQTDLEKGVAGGVLVVRSEEDCAKLLYLVLTNQLRFKIKNKIPEKERGNKTGYTALEETLSESDYRIVTDSERLTNSFWNRFNRQRNDLNTYNDNKQVDEKWEKENEKNIS